MRILHVTDGDPREPGIGGSAIRTWEIDRRLAERHDITALVPSYPGAQERHEDGIHWVPVGPPLDPRTSRLLYRPLLIRHLLVRRYDLLVEEFSVPFSVSFTPLFTRKPVIASVQWMFAKELAAKYHLPFDLVERYGVRLYHTFISMSDWLAETIRAYAPDARIETIPNGVDALALETESASPEHLLFIGRIDIHHKGLDLLVEVMRRLRARLGDATPPLLIVGSGPDEEELQRRCDEAGIRDLVRMMGRVDGKPKYDLLASSYALLMASRYESFGMVAAEALASGTPLIAFDVGPLREVAGPGGARIVPPDDLDAYVAEVEAIVTQPRLFHELRGLGRAYGSRMGTWDDVAARQEALYLQTVEWHRRHGSRPAHREAS